MNGELIDLRLDAKKLEIALRYFFESVKDSRGIEREG